MESSHQRIVRLTGRFPWELCFCSFFVRSIAQHLLDKGPPPPPPPPETIATRRRRRRNNFHYFYILLHLIKDIHHLNSLSKVLSQVLCQREFLWTTLTRNLTQASLGATFFGDELHVTPALVAAMALSPLSVWLLAQTPTRRNSIQRPSLPDDKGWSWNSERMAWNQGPV